MDDMLTPLEAGVTTPSNGRLTNMRLLGAHPHALNFLKGQTRKMFGVQTTFTHVPYRAPMRDLKDRSGSFATNASGLMTKSRRLRPRKLTFTPNSGRT